MGRWPPRKESRLRCRAGQAIWADGLGRRRVGILIWEAGFHFPFELGDLEGQSSPLFGRAPEDPVIDKFPAELGDRLAGNKARGLHAAKDVVQLVIGAVAPGVSWVFAAASRLTADIVLFGEAARMEGLESHQPRLEDGDALFESLDLFEHGVLFHIR